MGEELLLIQSQFGPMVSYLYTWAVVSTVKPGSAAIISLIFGQV